MRLFKTANYYEQSDEEQQRFIINFLQKFRYMFKRCNKSNHCNKYSYKCNSKTCLCMCYKKNDCCQEYKAAYNKACFVSNSFSGIRVIYTGYAELLILNKLFSEAEIKNILLQL